MTKFKIIFTATILIFVTLFLSMDKKPVEKVVATTPITPTMTVAVEGSSVKSSAGKKNDTSINTKIESQTRSVKFGAVVSEFSDNVGDVFPLQEKLDTKISTVSIFKHFGLPSNKYLPPNLQTLKESNINLQIAWEPWNPEEGLTQSVDYLTQIPLGTHDTYITEFANSIKNYGGNVTLRFGHEMNGNWYPWSRPGEYVNAYRYIVDKFRSLGVSNVKFMWSVNAQNVPSSPISTLESFYPGAEYVDIIGIDGFNFGGQNWQSFSQIFTSSYNFLQKYNKPIYISETASAENGGDKSQWVKSMFAKELANFPKIEEIVWFNIQKERDWRVDSSPQVLEAFNQAL